MKVTPAMVRRSVKKWRKRLAIAPKWTINFAINERENDEDEENRDCIARIEVEGGYFSALLVVNAWQVESLEELDAALCHEVTHIVLHPLFNTVRCALGDKFDSVGREMVEQACELITHALTSK